MLQEKLLWIAVLQQTLSDFAAGDRAALEWLHSEFAQEAVDHPLVLKRKALKLGPARVGELIQEVMSPQSNYEYRGRKVSLRKWRNREGDWKKDKRLGLHKSTGVEAGSSDESVK